MDRTIKDRILEVADIVDVVGERVTLKPAGRNEFKGLCPFHPDKNPSLRVNRQKGIFKCFSCGVGGDAIRFVERSQKLSFVEALEHLGQRYGIDVRQDAGEAKAAATQRDHLRRICEWARQFFVRQLQGPNGAAARQYVRSRGISDESIERFRLGLAPDGWSTLLDAARAAGLAPTDLQAAGLASTSENQRTYDRFRNRLMFPIHDSAGRCVAFGGRALGDDPAKYLNSPESPLFSKSHVLYGFDLARPEIGKRREALVVEGYIDALMLHQYGFTHAVATLGTALTDGHMKLLRPHVDRVVLCFDSDDAGLRAADRAIEAALRHKIEVLVAVPTDGKDPAECLLTSGTAGFSENLQRAVSALEFKWQGVRSRASKAGSFAVRAAAEEFVEFFRELCSRQALNLLIVGEFARRLSEVLDVPVDRVQRLLLSKRKEGAAPGADAATQPVTPEDGYRDSLRGLPAGLVLAVETLVGVTLERAQHSPATLECVASVGSYCSAWKQLAETLERLAEDQRPPSFELVMAAVDSPEGLALLECARQRLQDAGGSAAADAAEFEQALVQRVEQELAVLRTQGVRAALRHGADDPEVVARLFDTLRRGNRQLGGAVALRHREAAMVRRAGSAEDGMKSADTP